MEICGFLQGGNSKQFQSSDEITLALCRKRSGQLYVRHEGGSSLSASQTLSGLTGFAFMSDTQVIMTVTGKPTSLDES